MAETTINTGWLTDYDNNYFAPRNLFTTVFEDDTGISLKDAIYKVNQKLDAEAGWKPLLLHYNSTDTIGEDPGETKNLVHYSLNLLVSPNTGDLYSAGNITSNTISSGCLYLNDNSVGYGTEDPEALLPGEQGRVYFKLVDV